MLFIREGRIYEDGLLWFWFWFWFIGCLIKVFIKWFLLFKDVCRLKGIWLRSGLFWDGCLIGLLFKWYCCCWSSWVVELMMDSIGNKFWFWFLVLSLRAGLNFELCFLFYEIIEFKRFMVWFWSISRILLGLLLLLLDNEVEELSILLRYCSLVSWVVLVWMDENCDVCLMRFFRFVKVMSWGKFAKRSVFGWWVIGSMFIWISFFFRCVF